MLITFGLLCSNIVFVFANQDNLIQIETQIENFDDYCFIDNYSNTIILTSQNAVTKIDEQKVVSYDNDDTQTGICNAKFSVVTKSFIAIFDSLNRIQMYNQNFEYIKTFMYVEGETKYNLGNIISITKDYAGNLYFVDGNANKVLSLQISNDNITEINIDFDINSSTKICVNANGNLLAINTNDQNLIFDIANNLTITSFTASASDLYFDYEDNLFVLNGNIITKFDNENYTLSQTQNFDCEIKSASLDIETGTFYILADKLYSFYKQDFAQNASLEIAPIDITATQILTEQVEFANANKNTLLYSTCVSFASSDEIIENQLVMILKKDITQNHNMWYCLTNINGIQKQGYVAKSDLTLLQKETANLPYKTICKNVEIKSYPTKNASTTGIIAAENTQVIVLGTAQNFVDCYGNNYFAVQTENGVGYIKQNFLTSSQNFESTQVQVASKDNGQTKFIAFIITTISLLVVTIFACVLIAKKKNKYNKM